MKSNAGESVILNPKRSELKKPIPSESKMELTKLRNEIRELLSKEEDYASRKFTKVYEEGIKNLNRGHYEKAIMNFEDALKIYPNHYYAQKYLIEAISVKDKQDESGGTKGRRVDRVNGVMS